MGAEQSAPAPASTSRAPSLTVTSPTSQGVKQRALIISGPTGVGKESLTRLITDRYPATFGLVQSHTTRPQRPDETGSYVFCSRDEFEQGIHNGNFLEYVKTDGHYFGTSRASVMEVLRGGKVAVLDVDVQGVRQLRSHNLGGMFVFVAPPSLEELAARLKRSGIGSSSGSGSAQTPDALARAAELDLSCLTEPGLFDYLLVNADLESTFQELLRIAQRVVKGLPPEPGMLPDKTLLEKLVHSGHTVRHSGTGSPLSSRKGSEAPPSAGSEASGASPVAPARRSSSGGDAALADGAQGGEHVPGSEPTVGKAAAAGEAMHNQQPAHTPAALHQHHQHEQQQQQQAPSTAVAALAPSAAAPRAAAATSPAAAAAPLVAAAGTSLTPRSGTQQPHTLAAADGSRAAPSQAATGAPATRPGLEGWRGRVALVTGASSGIGWATCEALGRAGMRVVAVARRRERLEALQQHMTSPAVGLAPVDFLPVVCDITKEPEVAALPRIVVKRWPGAGIDILINNAGLARNDASLFSGNTAAWLEMLSTNILGNAMCTREVLQDMQRRNSWGHIINMVGLSGHRIPDAPAGGTFFAATKFAVRALTEGLRQEARGRQLPLRVTGISPGLVETEFFAVRSYGDEEAARKVTSAIKCLDAADVANAILWALSVPQHVEVNDVVIRPTQQMI